jgi:hypothetical protein
MGQSKWFIATKKKKEKEFLDAQQLIKLISMMMIH